VCFDSTNQAVACGGRQCKVVLTYNPMLISKATGVPLSPCIRKVDEHSSGAEYADVTGNHSVTMPLLVSAGRVSVIIISDKLVR